MDNELRLDAYREGAPWGQYNIELFAETDETARLTSFRLNNALIGVDRDPNGTKSRRSQTKCTAQITAGQGLFDLSDEPQQGGLF